MKRLKPLDVLLLCIVVPVWVTWFAVLTNRHARVGVTVAAAKYATDYPTVSWVENGAGRGGLAVGDALIRAGHEELQGVGEIGFTPATSIPSLTSVTLERMLRP